MFSSNVLLHELNLENVSLPDAFTYPFQYIPHELALLASKDVQSYLETQTNFNGNFDKLGKMFGVLIVKTSDDELGYLTAFSGKIDEKVYIDGFVPPVFDTLNPQGFFKLGEQELNQINIQIDDFLKDESYLILKQQLTEAKQESELEIHQFKNKIKEAKQLRDLKRKQNDLSYEELQNLKNESIRLNYLLKDLKRNWQVKIGAYEKQLNEFEEPLLELKKLRKEKSALLQKRLHESYQFLNANGNRENLLSIFEDYPPAGAGECALPKLLQYAYQENLKPIAMAEFWWGKSPSSEIKVHKHFYPSCKSKCKPILGFMLKGLSVDENPVKNRGNITLDIIYEDEYLLVLNKPHGFLSVDGQEIKDSVASRMRTYLSDATGMLMVHRLDMATSGLMVVAKSSEVHKNLQQQFTDRSVKKRYVAILDGVLEVKEGVIELPLRVDYHNRPRQLVCYETGKPALTRFEVVEIKDGKTKIHLYPETGRTHQLRVHCAHPSGLNLPIIGDVLYGNQHDRLHLHAECLEFIHPVFNKRMKFNLESSF